MSSETILGSTTPMYPTTTTVPTPFPSNEPVTKAVDELVTKRLAMTTEKGLQRMVLTCNERAFLLGRGMTKIELGALQRSSDRQVDPNGDRTTKLCEAVAKHNQWLTRMQAPAEEAYTISRGTEPTIRVESGEKAPARNIALVEKDIAEYLQEIQTLKASVENEKAAMQTAPQKVWRHLCSTAALSGQEDDYGNPINAIFPLKGRLLKETEQHIKDTAEDIAFERVTIGAGVLSAIALMVIIPPKNVPEPSAPPRGGERVEGELSVEPERFQEEGKRQV